MNKAKGLDIRKVALVGVLSALVFVLSMLEIPIPLALGEETRLHLGNLMCLLAGVLFGPYVGGLSAGFGSMFYDLTHPLYVSEFWITFIMKFAMGFVAGAMARSVLKKLPDFFRCFFSALAGAGVYIVLYLAKTVIMQRFVLGNPSWPAIWALVGAKGIISGVNGLIAVVGCALLAPPLRRALDAAGLFRQGPGKTGKKDGPKKGA